MRGQFQAKRKIRRMGQLISISRQRERHQKENPIGKLTEEDQVMIQTAPDLLV
jgi:hypothetical protein